MASLPPYYRQSSLTGTPASAWASARAICSAVNRDFLILCSVLSWNSPVSNGPFLVFQITVASVPPSGGRPTGEIDPRVGFSVSLL